MSASNGNGLQKIRGSVVGRFLRLFTLLAVVGTLAFAFIELGLLGRKLPALGMAQLTVESHSRAASERFLMLLDEVRRDAMNLRSLDEGALEEFLAAHPALAEASTASVSVRATGKTPVGLPIEVGTMRFRLSAEGLARTLFAGLTREPALHDAVLDGHGRVLAVSPPDAVVPQPAALPPDTVISTGMPLPWSIERLHPLPLVGLSVLTRKDLVGDPVRTNILVGLSMFTVVLVLAAGLAAGYVVRPLKVLQQGAQRIARGDRGFQIAVLSNDEVGALAEDFNHMARVVAERERELEETNEALKRASELKTMFLANVSHELRTPLTAILGFTDVLRDRIKGPVNNAQAELLDKLRSNAKSLQHLIDDLLDISRIEAGGLELEFEDVPLGECLEAAYSAVEPQIRGKRLEFEVGVPDAPVVVRGDYRRLVQVFVNLLANAVKFTDAGVVGVRVQQVDGRAVVRVYDTGSGIDSASLPHVFEEFRQGDGGINRKHGGAGLGLAICRRLVALHGGSIEVESTVGKGTTFTILLPAIATATSPSGLAPAAAEGASS